jgi:hypothetical protein
VGLIVGAVLYLGSTVLSGGGSAAAAAPAAAPQSEISLQDLQVQVPDSEVV